MKWYHGTAVCETSLVHRPHRGTAVCETSLVHRPHLTHVRRSEVKSV